MDESIIKSDDTEIEEGKFKKRCLKSLINDIDIKKIVISNKVHFSKHDFEYFIKNI